MHLAICAENAADRKQLERLLKRESDRTSGQYGPLYVDSFGSPENMLQNPMQYDGFFLDVSETESFPSKIIRKMDDYGVRAPIVICACCFTDFPPLSEHTGWFYLAKPVKPEMLSQIIKQVRSIRDSAEPLIEFRAEGQTHYVTEPEILYAVSSKDSIDIHLTGNRILNIQNSIPNLFSEISIYESFFAPSRKAILNARHMTRLKGCKADMSDGSSFSVSFTSLSYAKYAFRKFHDGSPT